MVWIDLKGYVAPRGDTVFRDIKQIKMLENKQVKVSGPGNKQIKNPLYFRPGNQRYISDSRPPHDPPADPDIVHSYR
jgi:hypothetical protein